MLLEYQEDANTSTKPSIQNKINAISINMLFVRSSNLSPSTSATAMMVYSSMRKERGEHKSNEFSKPDPKNVVILRMTCSNATTQALSESRRIQDYQTNKKNLPYMRPSYSRIQTSTAFHAKSCPKRRSDSFLDCANPCNSATSELRVLRPSAKTTQTGKGRICVNSLAG